MTKQEIGEVYRTKIKINEKDEITIIVGSIESSKKIVKRMDLPSSIVNHGYLYPFSLKQPNLGEVVGVGLPSVSNGQIYVGVVYIHAKAADSIKLSPTEIAECLKKHSEEKMTKLMGMLYKDFLSKNVLKQYVIK